jgi:hypothetical protein
MQRTAAGTLLKVTWIPHIECSKTLYFSVPSNQLNGHFGGVVSVFVNGPRVAGSDLAEVMDFKGDKNSQHTFLQMGSKADGPML